MITHAGTIGINVSDQQRALEFYAQKLGFQIIRDEPMGPGQDSPRWIELAPAGAQTHFVLFTPQGMEARIGHLHRAGAPLRRHPSHSGRPSAPGGRD